MGREPRRHMKQVNKTLNKFICMPSEEFTSCSELFQSMGLLLHVVQEGQVGPKGSQIFSHVQHNSCESLSSAGTNSGEKALNPWCNTSLTKSKMLATAFLHGRDGRYPKEQLRHISSLLGGTESLSDLSVRDTPSRWLESSVNALITQTRQTHVSSLQVEVLISVSVFKLLYNFSAFSQYLKHGFTMMLAQK